MIDLDELIAAARAKATAWIRMMVGDGHPEVEPKQEELVLPFAHAFAKQLNHLEDRLERIELRLRGICPTCKVRPEPLTLTPTDRQYMPWSEAMRAMGVDPTTGHAIGCAEAEANEP